MKGDRYKIIIGMDILKNMIIDLNQEVLRYKLDDNTKVNLKLTPRSVVFRTKQVKEYREYLRKIQPTINQANELEVWDDVVSVCPIEEEVAEYVGPQLTAITAIALTSADTAEMDVTDQDHPPDCAPPHPCHLVQMCSTNQEDPTTDRESQPDCSPSPNTLPTLTDPSNQENPTPDRAP